MTQSVISQLLICFISKKPIVSESQQPDAEYICSTFLSKLLPNQFLFCPQKLISSVWLIAIIFPLFVTIRNAQLFFHDSVKHCSIIHFGRERLGVLSPKLTLVGRTLRFLQALDCAPVSFFPCFPAPAARPVCFWLQLPASCSLSSLVSGLVCFLELCGNWKFPL